jgi:hypothetical protein
MNVTTTFQWFNGQASTEPERSDSTEGFVPRFEPDLRDYIAFSLGAVPEVQAIFASQQGRVWHIWTVVSESTPEVRKRLYDKEKMILGHFDGATFDFNIIASRERDPIRLVADPSARIVYRESVGGR